LPCAERPRSEGDVQADGIHFDAGTAYECNMGGGWTPFYEDLECEEEENVTKCEIMGEDWEAVPYDPGALPNDGYDYQLFETSDWTPPISELPTATLADPSPSLACIQGIDVATGVQTYCQENIPQASGEIFAPECTEVSGESTTNGVQIECPPPIEGTGKVVTSCKPVPPSEPNYVETLCVPEGGTSTKDTLADVAEYYWKTDLRTPDLGNCEVATGNVCTNTEVPRQNMRTFTLGLGASGVMQFRADYGNYMDPGMEPLAHPDEGGDLYSITMGIWPDPTNGVCSWQKAESGPCGWPKPVSNRQTNIDDLWHAAINGRGTYFSAENPSAMATGISAALQEVLAKEGSRTAPTFNGKELKEGLSVFLAKFVTGTWAGDLGKFAVAAQEGSAKGEAIWSAQSLLDARINDKAKGHANRTIHTFAAGVSGKLKPFTWEALTADEQTMFTDLELKLSQLCVALPGCLPPALHALAGGEALVNFLRGDRSNEGPSSNTLKYFRQRGSALGDIVDSSPVYVQAPTMSYADPGYGEFKERLSAPRSTERAGMIYVGANDGMLHAFDAQTGEEAWAFVPSLVMADLYRLADKNYSAMHRFFVDGTPVVGDVCFSGCNTEAAVWKTILVGGLNHGGRGYYALDVTDPANPKALWEFTDANMGYSYGNPVISKLADGQWVVMVTSGYNNADGMGHLFILEAETGRKLNDLSTGAGSAESPSGLSKIANFVYYPEYNNLTLRVYGGDLLGNLWRFDLNGFLSGDSGETGTNVQRLATLKSGDFEDENGVSHPAESQPITSAPQLGMINNRHVAVFVGTGQLLGNPDLTTTGIQSMYGIKDPLTAFDYGDPRTTGAFVRQEMREVACPVKDSLGKEDLCEEGEEFIITVTKDKVDWATQSGWYVDFPVPGERVVNNIDLRNSVLAITTNTPQSGVCTPAGTSDLYFLDYVTGGYVRGEGDYGRANFGHMDSLGSDLTVVQGPNGPVIVQGNDNQDVELSLDPPVPEKDMNVRRISWRELIVE
jgi:type IV pilus assembly protein PilY1